MNDLIWKIMLKTQAIRNIHKKNIQIICKTLSKNHLIEGETQATQDGTEYFIRSQIQSLIACMCICSHEQPSRKQYQHIFSITKISLVCVPSNEYHTKIV